MVSCSGLGVPKEMVWGESPTKWVGSGEAKRTRKNPRIESQSGRNLGAPGQLVLGMESSVNPT